MSFLCHICEKYLTVDFGEYLGHTRNSNWISEKGFGMNHQVIIYPPGENKNVLAKFYLSQQKSARRKILKQLKYLKEYGLRSEVLNTKKLRGYELWEIRILGKENIRLIAIEHRGIIYIVNIFSKKSNKTPRKELALSKKRHSILTAQDE